MPGPLVPTLSNLIPSTTLAFAMPRGYEWLVIGLVVLLLFGKRLPGAARGIGDAIREFRRGLKLGQTDVPPGPSETAIQSGSRHS